jgi:hypothetical protein
MMDTGQFYFEDAFIHVKVKADTWRPLRVVCVGGDEVGLPILK